jgi:hypothetical protein
MVKEMGRRQSMQLELVILGNGMLKAVVEGKNLDEQEKGR